MGRFGLAVRRSDLGSNLLRLSFLFKSCGLWTLSCDFVPHNYETLKWLPSLPTLMQKSFWWWQCSDRYIISLSLSPHLHTPFSDRYIISLSLSPHLHTPFSDRYIISLSLSPHLHTPFSDRYIISLSLSPHLHTPFSDRYIISLSLSPPTSIPLSPPFPRA